jgi:nicotinamidase-related amidase
MGATLANLDHSILVLVDLQTKFLASIPDAERVLARSDFMARAAAILGIPALASAQYPERLGEVDLRFAGIPSLTKRRFSCAGDEEFDQLLSASGRNQVVLCGVESHICVLQTALDLVNQYDVFVVEDAAAARTSEMHRNALARCQQAGVKVAHSESIVYEWMRTSEHSHFREILSLVKSYPAS